MSNPENRDNDENIHIQIDKSAIARFAHECYLLEPGTKQAVDDGIITMFELEIAHYINAWTNENTPSTDNSEEGEKIYTIKLKEAYEVVAGLYSIDKDEARRIFEKVSKIPRASKK